jgi:hypothetical protein
MALQSLTYKKLYSTGKREQARGSGARRGAHQRRIPTALKISAPDRNNTPGSAGIGSPDVTSVMCAAATSSASGASPLFCGEAVPVHLLLGDVDLAPWPEHLDGPIVGKDSDDHRHDGEPGKEVLDIVGGECARRCFARCRLSARLIRASRLSRSIVSVASALGLRTSLSTHPLFNGSVLPLRRAKSHARSAGKTRTAEVIRHAPCD